MYSEAWGGLPPKAFLARLDPKLAELRDRLYDKAHPPGTSGRHAVSDEWARRSACAPGIAIAMGGFDAHYGAVGSGITHRHARQDHRHVHLRLRDRARRPTRIADIPGICGIVNGSIMPDYFGIEAGQSAVGDILNWWVEGVCQGGDALHARAVGRGGALAPGRVGPRRARLEQRQPHDPRRPAADRAASSARRCTPRAPRSIAR